MFDNISLQSLKTGWNFIRIVRLILAVFVAYQAVDSETWWMLAVTVALLYQVVANVGCRNNSCEKN